MAMPRSPQLSLSLLLIVSSMVIAGHPASSTLMAGSPAPEAAAVETCTFSQGYWKNHAANWPVGTLVLGDGGFALHSYSQAQLLAILNTPSRGDASVILALQLIAAKLNVAGGSNPAPIAKALADADTLLHVFRRRLPYNERTTTPTGTTMVATAAVLERYNTGQTPGSCGQANRAPVADAGADQTVALGATVTLDGTRSSDPDGNPLAYRWTFTSRPADSSAVLSNPASARPTFVADLPGTFELQLVVNDGLVDSAAATVRISTHNSRPVANAGPDQTVALGATVHLTGALSTDPDGDALTFAWTLASTPAGSTAALEAPTTVTPSFVADRAGQYRIDLVVSDGSLSSVADSVTVSTLNTAPVADAGDDLTAAVGETITLDGRRSTDVDGNPLSYRWTLLSRPETSNAALQDPNTVTPGFVIDRAGEYVAQLIVNDGLVDSVADTVVVTTRNTRPVANAGANQSALTGDLVQLDGSASTDADGDAITYAWSFTVRPTGSSTAFGDATAVRPTFTPDLAGTYIAQLIVSDATTSSDPATVTVTVAARPPDNRPPTAEAGEPQSVARGATVALDGSASSDPDGNTLTFRWSLTAPAGSAAVLSDSTIADPTFVADVHGNYVVQLIVNDGTVDSAPDTVSISTQNSTPIARAGDDQSVATGSTVQLNGGGSSDPDGTALQFSWSLISRPDGSGATVSNATIANPTFVADVSGVYVAQLTVGDGLLVSAPDTVAITVATGADLRVHFELFPGNNQSPGHDVAWLIDFNNAGPATATDVTILVPLPAGYTMNGFSVASSDGDSGGTYDPATGVWSIPRNAAGHLKRLGMNIRINRTGPYVLRAEITQSSAPDPNLANNVVTLSPSFNMNADLAITFHSFSPGNRVPGEILSVLFDVQNNGPAPASGITAEIPLPAGLTLVNPRLPEGTTYDAVTGVWAFNDLPHGHINRIILDLRLNPTGPTEMPMRILNSSQPDPNLANNSNVVPRINRPPVASAGPDQSISTHTLVTVDGTGTFDPDGDAFTRAWTFVLRPINSAATLSSVTAISPTFVPDLPGPYVAQLTVTDSFGVVGIVDTARFTAVVTNSGPTIVSPPVTSAFVGQSYQYDVNATDPDAGQLLTYSLTTAPAGMTIDAATGLIAWTPSESQGGQQPVVVRVQDPGGLFATQSYVVQVSSSSNGVPVANDDAFNVRVTESLSVAAPGVVSNDVDENPLSARIVSSPANGTARMNPDGSFTYTPFTMQEGEFVLAENVNLANRMPGVVASGGGQAHNAVDENILTNWGSSGQALEIAFPTDVTVRQVQVVGDREINAHKATAGIFELLSGTGTVLHSTGPVEILGPLFDATLNLPNLAGVRRVRFRPTAANTGFVFGVSLAEMRVIGSGLIRRQRFVEPNLIQLLATTVTSNSENGGNVRGRLIDDNDGTNWFAFGNAGDFIEVTFPRDVTVTEFTAQNPNGRPDGFGTSLGIACVGRFTLLDASRAVIFDTGLVNEPSGFMHPTDPFTFTVPSVGSVRHARYTLSSCTGSFPAGFSEWRIVGTADVIAPAFSISKKFQALHGLEAHSTPIVVNLTDDNGDGRIDHNDIPDIVVPVEFPENQLRGEIKAISGDDGRLLFTAGSPNLVSPWSELAAGDLDGDGDPEIVAVHGDRNHLIAFDHTGALHWLSDAHTMPSFNLGGGVGVGAVTIANLDGTGAPEIIIGASVFDADGHLIADGRTVSGTTGGGGSLRTSSSVVADIDLDGVPELVAGPTAYRLVGGTLTRVWRRTDRPDGYAAIANLDDDPQAEIVYVANGVVYVLNHDGSDYQDWNAPSHAPVSIPRDGMGGPPLVVDVNGDGRPEIGVAAATTFVVFNRDGSVRWSSGISDSTSNSTGAVAFDLNGDGEVEIIYRDERFLRIYRGDDGLLLARTKVGSATWGEEPVVADVDNDGHADIIVSSDLFTQAQNDTGIMVFQDVANRWKRTRRIWNQHGYHVTNVNEDASIPTHETPHWLVPGLNNFRTNAFVAGESADETDSFTYVASDGVLESNAATVSIAIRTPNSAPQFVSTPVTTAASGVFYSYAAQAEDPDAGDVLTFSLPNAPAGMTIDAASGFIAWTPTAAQTGTHAVVVKVADVRGLYAVQGYTVIVGASIVVPDVVGQPEGAAASTITAAGLSVGAITSRHSAGVATGSVISQNPAAGSSAAPSAPVSIVVSLGTPPVGTVPNVVGLQQSNAVLDVEAAGYTSAIATLHNAVVPAGRVISQSPAGGTTAATGTAVNLVISLGLPPGELDLDGDGFTGDQGDCNDANASINPAAVDIPGDGIDQNCNGVDSIVGDNTPPTATLASPDDLAVVTIPTNIVGTATDTNLLRYTVTVAEVDSIGALTIGSGTTAVTNGQLGRLDPTMLENGLYRVRLIVEDVNGQIAVDERVYRVDGQAKVGNFRISFVDASVPVAGIPISVVRTYDSRVKSREDFGIGWTLDVTRGRYRHNRTPGRGWIIRDQPFLGEFLPCIGGSLETLSHLTEVRLSDHESYTFALEITNGNVGITGACEGTARFRFVEGTRLGATLEILDGTSVLYLRGGEDSVLNLDDFLEGTNRVYDPQRVRLTTIDGTRIELERRNGITRILDLNGNALTMTANGIVSSTGKSISFTRDADGRITRITDPMGHELTYAYGDTGDLVRFQDAAGNDTTFLYDSDHNLLEIIDPLGNRAGRSEYDADGRLIAVIDASGNRLEMTHDLSNRRELVTDRTGGITTIEYDDRGNVLRKTDPLGHTTHYTYDSRDNVLTQVDPLGNTRIYAYDARDNKISDTDALGNTTTYTYNSLSQVVTRTDPRGGITTTTYDANGNMLSETSPTGSVTRMRYNDRGQPIQMTDPTGATTSFAYDSFGREVASTDPLGNVTRRTYDANGRLLTETSAQLVGSALELVTMRYIYDERGLIVGVVNPDGELTATTYAPSGRQTSMTDALGRVTRFEYDEQGRPAAVEHPDASTEQFEYDAEGRRTAVIDPLGRRIAHTYDAAGRAISMRNPDGTTRSTTYDAAGRPVAQTDENGRTRTAVFDAAGRMTSTTNARGETEQRTYDALGSILSQQDANGRSTTYVYDLDGRLTRTTFADGSTVSQTFDAAGRLLSRIDQEGHETRYEYDVRGNLTAVVDPLGNRTTYEYDALGNRVATRDAAGRTTRYTYDHARRLRSTTRPLGQTRTNTYDPIGNLIATVDFNGELTLYGWDHRDRLITRMMPGSEVHQFTYTPTGRMASMTDTRGRTTFEYDAQDRPIVVRQPDGQEIRYTYDAVGNRQTLTTPVGTTEFTYDQANRLTTVADSTGNRVNFEYDALGKPTHIEYPGGLTTDLAYDTLNRLTSVVHQQDETTVASYAYTLGLRGQRVQVREHTGRQVDYTYDAVGRLTREAITSGGATTANDYTYDAVGNRLTKSGPGGVIAYAYDANHRLTSAGPMSFAYDANGNQTSRTVAGATTGYAYDVLGRLRQVTAPGGAVTRYTYDAFNQRVQRVTPTATTNFLVDPAHPSGLSQVLVESDGTGQTIASYLQAGSIPLAQDRSGQTSFRLTDGYGSTRQLADEAGAVTDSFDYDAFGNLVSRTGTTPSPFLFNGQEFDATAGLYHLRARDYDPTTGRFNSVDPFAGVQDRPVTMHPYLYAENDPVNLSDPTGEYTLLEVMFVTNIAMTVGFTAYDLYHGHYKSAAVGVAISVVPFGSLFKGVFRAIRVAGSTLPRLMSGGNRIVNLPPGAVTEIARLAPEFPTELNFAVDNIATAAAAVPDVNPMAIMGRAVESAGSTEAVHLFLSNSDDLKNMYEALKKMYVQGFNTASDFMPYLRKTVGQPGWEVKLCALASAHYVFMGQSSNYSLFATMVEVGINLTLRGSGYRCTPRS